MEFSLSASTLDEARRLGFDPAWILAIGQKYGADLVNAALASVRDHGLSVAAVTDFFTHETPELLQIFDEVLSHFALLKSPFGVEHLAACELLGTSPLTPLLVSILTKYGPAGIEALATLISNSSKIGPVMRVVLVAFIRKAGPFLLAQIAKTLS